MSLCLQSLNAPTIQAFGYSNLEAGVCSSVFQLSSAVFGVSMGGYVTNPTRLRRVLICIHAVALISNWCVLTLGWLVSIHGHFAGSVPLMVVAVTVSGASFMSFLPFVLQQVVLRAYPVSESFSGGCVVFVAMGMAAILNQLGMMIPPAQIMLIIVLLLMLEFAAFIWMLQKGMLTPKSSALLALHCPAA